MAKLASLVLAFLLAAGTAFASPLHDARANGWLGERPDGYIGLVDPGAPAGAQALMNDVNAKRRALYEQRAQSQGVRLSDYQVIAAKEIYESLPSGTYVMGADGGWTRKP